MQHVRRIVMLGKYVKVSITQPIDSYNKQFGYHYKLNYGVIRNNFNIATHSKKAYVMGINHPVKNFDGRVIAIIKRKNGEAWSEMVPVSSQTSTDGQSAAETWNRRSGQLHADETYSFY